MTDQEVQPILRRKADESIISAFEVLRKRIDKFGLHNQTFNVLEILVEFS